MEEEFLNFLKSSSEAIFIEAEAKAKRMEKFINEYNKLYNKNINWNSTGIIVLDESDDKWGLELRIYFNDVTRLPKFWNDKKEKNRAYRSNEFCYRISNNRLVLYLFENGYQLGYN